MQVNEGWKPTIVAFCCNWCSYAGADLSGTNRLQLSRQCQNHPHPVLLPPEPDVHSPRVSARRGRRDPLRLPSRRLPLYDRQLLRPTAHDAAVLACSTILGIEKGRTRVEWVSAAEGAKFAATMNEFVKTITELGENRRLEDLRCKE